jgi:peptidoglycan hydrolase CwlO-like protein
MESEETKVSYFNFSPTTMWAILLGIVTTGSGAIYVGITTYNRVIAATEAIEEAKPYDDAELRNEIGRLKIQLSGMESSVNNVKDSMVASSNQLVAVSEKASTAKGEAMEAKASANGTGREVNAALSSIREEIRSTKEGLEARMKALQKASTNPLSGN